MRDHQDIAYERGYERAIEACIDAVDAEEELNGPMPDALRSIPLEDALRAVVRAIKRSIRERIEKLQH
jgi:hypothetical protein